MKIKISNINGLISAKYGNNNTFIDVTEIIKSNIGKTVIVGNDLFKNDPLVNIEKKLSFFNFKDRIDIINESIILDIYSSQFYFIHYKIS